MLMFQPFKKYSQLSGRARRAEFWLFEFFVIIAFFILSVIDEIQGNYRDDLGIGLLSGLFILFTIIPSITVSVRRLHDTDRSGYWVLALVVLSGVAGKMQVPVLGEVLSLIFYLILLAFCCLDGTKGENRYGPDPKSR